MATSTTPPLISSEQFKFSASILPPLPLRFTAANNKNHCRVRCALSSNNWRESRRLFSISLVLSNLFLIPDRMLSSVQRIIAGASAGSFLDKYVKKKKLDPLEVYVPAVILTKLQIEDVGKILEGSKPEYATCRSLLRSGLASSLRVNIRAVAQYASEDGNGNIAFDNVDRCLRALEELDSSLLRATRNDQGTSIESMKTNIDTAVLALDRLLQTVPADVLAKGKAIADAYISPEVEETEIEDPQLKQLESIL
ncbi:uncharacterized protein E5676_scaffold187G00160 [Cucumis melo var. makuwa]|uniref:Uncharacterized protein LOC103488519 isoform X1 n=2 Tax=Cucumis melo TaxID=3656 RepID=A0ABM3KJS5_CUCME|nr:uncharacterized protein LOC103488519 isoform X1 [Cucumis melo]XP_050938044.1 uncharacterized protein LOC103488519 isoform X1 [Cucumis melo]KAA0064710.1 uncharacterized protein E6C27_scaffold82G00140 [Cucumis melo var. makuwa]TYK00728.1 uncharacterized protein E5676_scaffold187G00160 [Cucumis melo var. makuwa]